MSFAKGSDSNFRNSGHYLLTVVLTIVGFTAGIFIGAILSRILISDVETAASWKIFGLQFTPFIIGLATLFACLKYIHKLPIRSSITARKSFSWKRYAFAFFLWLTIQVVFLLTAIASGAPISFSFSAATFVPLLIISLTLLPIQTAFEDIFYRGFLFQALTNAVGRASLTILILAAIFGWMHAGNPEVAILGYSVLFYYILSGLFMGVLTHFDDGLELSMGYHFANNFFGAVIVTNSWQVFQTDALVTDHSKPEMGFELWAVLLIIQPALLYVFYKVYRWKNPKAKILE